MLCKKKLERKNIKKKTEPKRNLNPRMHEEDTNIKQDCVGFR